MREIGIVALILAFLHSRRYCLYYNQFHIYQNAQSDILNMIIRSLTELTLSLIERIG